MAKLGEPHPLPLRNLGGMPRHFDQCSREISPGCRGYSTFVLHDRPFLFVSLRVICGLVFCEWSFYAES